MAALSQGAKRGLFSNEAGMGSTPHAHAQANVKNPHEQGVVALIGVFVDTFIVVTITALVTISVLYTGDGALAQGMYDGIDKTNMAQIAFGSIFGDIPESGSFAVVKDGGTIEAVAGATITSRAVTHDVNDAIAQYNAVVGGAN